MTIAYFEAFAGFNFINITFQSVSIQCVDNKGEGCVFDGRRNDFSKFRISKSPTIIFHGPFFLIFIFSPHIPTILLGFIFQRRNYF